MKKLLCMLLAVMTLALPVLAEETNPFFPYVLTAPENVELAEGESSLTFVNGRTRVVAQVIDRVPDAAPAEAVQRMMEQFDPAAQLMGEPALAEGFVGTMALTEDKFGEGVNMYTIMVLSQEGELLILSGYSLDGDDAAVQTLLVALLESLTVNDQPVLLTDA